ncbi:hypothetical protein COT76_01640 [Candidatus Berkelbacteria bacterium CG10_big_fil_rev_8_21_14_0_10_33_10]|uniref:Primosomal protein N' 3' DNA-binding domain-containing protein n=1 Tax=Candidatus Berkelbacteria bacterium CG_4_10_14_0_2_um_filter_35_9_33_12 TaxID=1974499 RepID=A0A2M7W3W6_9BACT|nr:MAG: hypothetical protein COX10_02960 [Candidatus Berkelbacteria bacterium CG23_combo_of_CG06-09_8_20_14_all_33_15]PIS08398.1 MAG: hypothetical protein COT76_01640 [Candidatus Berkelbacteria bacterium CG10_big_fil_rev_8_21_14_0_10_33_10]PJA20091.1 MAG: hypothetical protein COX60_02850 [Candidatus Berkelbacteria bacterium CG_4_10_14_0_2_um_filter_35_9_33_12]
MKYVEAYVNHRLNNDEPLLYSIKPKDLYKIKIGQLIEVPFRNRKILAVVIKFTNRSVNYKVKNIYRIVSGKIYNNIHFELANYLSNNYYSPIGKNLFSFYGDIPKKIVENNMFNLEDKTYNQKQVEYYFSNDNQRLKFYEDLIIKNKKIVFAFATLKRAEKFAQLVGYKNNIYSNILNLNDRYDLIHKFTNNDESIIIGTRQAIFLQSNLAHIIVVDEYNHIGHENNSHPNYRSEKIVKILSKFGIKIYLFSTSPTISSINNKWNYLVDKQPKILFKSYLKSDDLNFYIESLVEKTNNILIYNPIYRSTSIFCNDCNEYVKCKNCWQNVTGIKSNGQLFCKKCQLDLADNICNLCNGANLKQIRFGLEDNLNLVKNITNDYTEISSYNIGNIDNKNKLVLATSKIFDYFNLKFERVVMFNFDFLVSSRNYNFDEKIIAILSNLKKMAIKELIITTKDEENNFFKLKTQNDLKKFYQAILKKRRDYKLQPFYSVINLVAQDNNPFKLKNDSKIIYQNLNKINEIICNNFTENIYNSKTKFWQMFLKIKIKKGEKETTKKELKNILYKLPNNWRYKVN